MLTGKKLLYAGSFDPLTNGHMDIIERGCALCGTLVIGVAKNHSKREKYPFDARSEMITLATGHLANVEIDSFDGLLADYVNSRGISAVLRGLRACADFEYEMQMAQMNARLYGGAETIFLMAAPSYSFVSSSMVHEVFSLGGDVSGLVPDKVLEYMKSFEARNIKETIR
ncbi:MAG: pantetheine-phosphate adenylyltransferase [Clostridiales Family XIII bacterium]|jgi:pantetheine-phosphate adenylyltransferase|nr:pantetheine-phosphate adenylyltransferase [Clostridiales Family XIII bacterium]